MSSAKPPKALLNLQRTSVLLADADMMGQSIVVQMLIGFGARALARCDEVAEARRQLAHQLY